MSGQAWTGSLACRCRMPSQTPTKRALAVESAMVLQLVTNLIADRRGALIDRQIVVVGEPGAALTDQVDSELGLPVIARQVTCPAYSCRNRPTFSSTTT